MEQTCCAQNVIIDSIFHCSLQSATPSTVINIWSAAASPYDCWQQFGSNRFVTRLFKQMMSVHKANSNVHGEHHSHVHPSTTCLQCMRLSCIQQPGNESKRMSNKPQKLCSTTECTEEKAHLKNVTRATLRCTHVSKQSTSLTATTAHLPSTSVLTSCEHPHSQETHKHRFSQFSCLLCSG